METLTRRPLKKQSDLGLCCWSMSVSVILEHLLTYGIFHQVELEWIIYLVLGHFGHGHFGLGRFGPDISATDVSATENAKGGRFGQNHNLWVGEGIKCYIK